MIDKKLLILFKEVTDVLDKATENVKGWTEIIKEKTAALDVSTEYPSLVEQKIELLRMADLTKIIKAYMPKSANAVAAYFNKGKTANRITLTYLKDRNILPIEVNKLIVVESEFVSREVENLFIDNSVALLK